MTAPVTPPAPSAITIRLGRGRAAARGRIREPAGAVRVYRISAPAGVRAAAWVRLPHLTVPLEIATPPVQPASDCRRTAARVVCSTGEEACPMPAGVWRVVIHKRAGPPGAITLRLVVGR